MFVISISLLLGFIGKLSDSPGKRMQRRQREDMKTEYKSVAGVAWTRRAGDKYGWRMLGIFD